MAGSRGNITNRVRRRVSFCILVGDEEPVCGQTVACCSSPEAFQNCVLRFRRGQDLSRGFRHESSCLFAIFPPSCDVAPLGNRPLSGPLFQVVCAVAQMWCRWGGDEQGPETQMARTATHCCVQRVVRVISLSCLCLDAFVLSCFGMQSPRPAYLASLYFTLSDLRCYT